MSHSQPAPVAIRIARPEDMSQLTQLQVNSIQILCAKEYNAGQLQALIENKKQGRNWKELIFIAEIDSQIVGFSALSLVDPRINGIYVHPAFIRQGIGTKLLIALENEAVRSKVRCLWVSASLNSVAFYQAQGYQILRKNSIWLGSGFGVSIPVVVLKKNLISPTQAEASGSLLMYILLIIFLVFAIIVPLIFGN